MRTFSRILVTVAAVATLASSVLASSPVGSWKGHFSFDTSKMPKQNSSAAQQQMLKSLDEAKKLVITLTLKANKTYVAHAEGKTQTPDKDDTGTWSQSGNTLTLTSSKKAPSGKPDSQKMVLSSDGKTLTMALPGGMGITAKIIFKR